MTNQNNYFVGTNTNATHVEEAIQQGIIEAQERLLGIFDGIFFDETGARVGGLALNDFLIVTDHRLITWARDQLKDYVDYFPLSHVFVAGQKNKDSLHGTLQLEVVLADVAEEGLAQAEKLPLTFDFVPLLDLKLTSDLIEVMSNLNRDMIAGGAQEHDRVKAAGLLFEQVFVSRVAKKPTKKRAAAAQSKPEYSEQFENEDDLMTPLYRLDALDGTPRRAKTQPAPIFDEDESYPLSEENIEDKQSRFRHAVNSISSRIEEENYTPRANRGNQASKAPGTRLREDVSVATPEGLYMISRAGRAAWDGLEKLRREAKVNGLIPPGFRENGMNLHEMTEFLLALNSLLDTLGSSPAAFELARTFVGRYVGGNVGMGAQPAKPAARGAKPTVKMEDAVEGNSDDIPTAAEEKGGLAGSLGNVIKRKHAVNMRVERRNNNSPAIPEVDPNDVAPVRHKVMIRKRGNEYISGAADSGGESEPKLANDEIMMLFSKLDVPALDNFDGLNNTELSFENFENSESEIEAHILETPVGPDLN